jgi:hypothetical protein
MTSSWEQKEVHNSNFVTIEVTKESATGCSWGWKDRKTKKEVAG